MAAAAISPKAPPRRCNGGSTAAVQTLSVPETSKIYNQRSSLSDSDRVSRLKVEIAAREKEDLEIIKIDVCQWLSNTLDITISPSSFMDTLDTGVVLCNLARLIQAKAKSEREAGEGVAVNIPMDTIKCQPNAGKGTFFARDNTANFIRWCKKLGVNEEVIFESNGLVQQEDEKRVILCLMDVSRFASKVNIRPPELVQLENEIDMFESDLEIEDAVFDDPPSSPAIVCRYHDVKMLHGSSSSSSNSEWVEDEGTKAIPKKVHVKDGSDKGKKEAAADKPAGVEVELSGGVKDSVKAGKARSQMQQGKPPAKKPVQAKRKTPSPKLEVKSPNYRFRESSNSPQQTRSPQHGPRLKSPHHSPRHISPQSPRRKSPHQSPRHRRREPEQSSQPKEMQRKKEEPTHNEEKTDELVVQMVGECKCHSNKLTIRIERSGKYIVRGGRIKDKKIIHARMLSDRIMVRVGGGWKSLDHFLLVHDPCRIEEMRLYDQGPLSPNKVIARRSPSPHLS